MPRYFVRGSGSSADSLPLIPIVSNLSFFERSWVSSSATLLSVR